MILTISIVLSFHCEAQTGIDPRYEKNSFGKRWNFSLYGNIVFSGPGEAIANYFESNEFGHRRPGATQTFLGLFAYRIEERDYPIHSKRHVWIGEVGYNLTRKSSLNLMVGEWHSASASGFHKYRQDTDPFRTGISLRWNSSLWGGSVNYKWRFGNGVNGIHLGPVLARHTLFGHDMDDRIFPEGEGQHALVAGVNVGGTIGFTLNDSWFVAMKANYLSIADRSIGPGIVRRNSPTPIERELGPASLSLSDFLLGLAIGWSIGPEVGNSKKQP